MICIEKMSDFSLWYKNSKMSKNKIELNEQFMCVIAFRVILMTVLEIDKRSINIDHISNPANDNI